MKCQECNFHMHVTYIICHVVMYISLRNPGNAAIDMSYWWVTLCYICDSVMCVTSVIDVSSIHMNKTFNFYMTICRSNWSMILDKYICLVVSRFFPLFLVCFVLDLCCSLHNNLAQIYMSCVLIFGINTWNAYCFVSMVNYVYGKKLLCI